MNRDYRDLRQLLQSNQNAKRYYNSLPQYAREMIGTRAQNIRSEDQLRRYAENCLAGDK